MEEEGWITKKEKPKRVIPEAVNSRGGSGRGRGSSSYRGRKGESGSDNSRRGDDKKRSDKAGVATKPLVGSTGKVTNPPKDSIPPPLLSGSSPSTALPPSLPVPLTSVEGATVEPAKLEPEEAKKTAAAPKTIVWGSTSIKEVLHVANDVDTSVNSTTDEDSLLAMEEEERSLLHELKIKVSETKPTDMPLVGNKRWARRGILNLGNTCFVTAVMQALLSFPEYHSLMTSLHKVFTDTGTDTKDYKYSSKVRSKVLHKHFPISSSCAKFSTEDCTSSSVGSAAPVHGETTLPKTTKGPADGNRKPNPIHPGEFLSTVLRLFRKDNAFEDVSQEDAQEFLTFIVDGLHSEIETIKGSTVTTAECSDGISSGAMRPDDTAPVVWQEVGKKNKKSTVTIQGRQSSGITWLFQGQLRSTYKVQGLRPSVTFEPFYTLPLDIHPDNVFSLSDCFDNCFREEAIDDDKGFVSSSKQVSICDYPAVLILYLKRFTYDMSSGTIKKINKYVAYEQLLTFDSAVQYRLSCCIVHRGQFAKGGHYVTYACEEGRGKDKEVGNTWWLLNDSSVVKVSEEEVLDQDAYLLFYRRK
jgi:ubiquitin carboxyl-terminal hydrolase 10